MDNQIYPSNYAELVAYIESMEPGDYIENDDTGHLRYVETGHMCEGRFELFEDNEFITCTDSAIQTADFIAEGWEGAENEQ